MSKKKIIEAALVDAEELERAAIENAKNVVIEAFTPSLTGLFKDVLAEDDEESLDDINPEDITESDDDDADDEFGDSDPEETVAEARRRRRLKEAARRRKLRESDDEDADDMFGDEDKLTEDDDADVDDFEDVFEEEDEHDMGKEPDLGRDDTDASGELEEDDDPYADADDDEELTVSEVRRRRRLREAKLAKLKRIKESRRRRKLREDGWEAEAEASARALKGIEDDEWEAVHDGDEYIKDPHAGEDRGPAGVNVTNKTGGSFQDKPKKSDPGRESLEGEQVANKTGGGEPVPGHPDPGKTDEIGLEDESPANQTSKDLAEARRRRRLKEASRRRRLREAEEDDEIDKDEDSDDDEVNINIDTDDEDQVDIGEDDGEDEELDVPEELFDDEDEVAEDDSEDEMDDDGEDDEIDLSIENDDDETASPIGGSDDMDLDSMMPDAVGEDDVEDGQLYIRKEGGFQKITPVEFLQSRLAELEQENAGLQAALQALQGQLKETHLFNAKLAYLNKAYASGAFNKTEKLALAERIDACEKISEVKKLYTRVMKEVQSHNPLDGFSNVIKEQRVRAAKKVENVYESTELRRMRDLAGLDD